MVSLKTYTTEKRDCRPEPLEFASSRLLMREWVRRRLQTAGARREEHLSSRRFTERQGRRRCARATGPLPELISFHSHYQRPPLTWLPILAEPGLRGAALTGEAQIPSGRGRGLAQMSSLLSSPSPASAESREPGDAEGDPGDKCLANSVPIPLALLIPEEPQRSEADLPWGVFSFTETESCRAATGSEACPRPPGLSPRERAAARRVKSALLTWVMRQGERGPTSPDGT